MDIFESRAVSVAAVFGNHDNESMMGVEWQCEQFMYNSTYCLIILKKYSTIKNG